MKKILLLVLLSLSYTLYVSAQAKVPIDEVSKHVGETVTICDKVYSGKFFEGSRNQITLLDVGGAVPNQKLTIVINAENRKNFNGKPEDTYNGKNICITGKVIDFKGKPEIIISRPEELQIQGGSSSGGEIRANDFMRFD